MSSLVLPFTKYLGDVSTFEDALYEFITNALDADNDKFPSVTVKGDTITIENRGEKALEKDNITTIGRTEKNRDPTRHGSHGIGLKDAIACCVRENYSLSIESNTKKMTFVAPDAHILLLESEIIDIEGTKITVGKVKNPELYVEAAQNRFLQFHQSLDRVTKLITETDAVEVYEKNRHNNSFREGAIFLRGVRKFGHPSLDYIYNIVNPTEAQKNSISRDHTFIPKRFKKHFRPEIQRVNPHESFGVQTPTPSSPEKVKEIKRDLPSSKAVQPTTIDSSLLFLVNDHCMEQDYCVWTCTTEEREQLRKVHSKMMKDLRTFKGLSVPLTKDQGSWAKNTFIPLVSDFDIIVEITEYKENPKEVSETLKSELRKIGARLEDSGKNITNCTYEGIGFDLVLNAESAKERFERIRNSPLQMQSFIRAMKYWLKRSGVGIKSCVIEESVEKMWNEIKGSRTPFQYFLDNVGSQLSDPTIKDFYDLTPESITETANVARKAVEELRKKA